MSTHRSVAGVASRVGPARLAWGEAGTGSDVALSAVDAARAASFGVERRAEFLTGRALVRGLLAEMCPGAEAGVTSASCPRCGEPHGGVLIEGAGVVASVAHAGGLVVAAVAAGGRRLGIDLESVEEADARLDDLTALIGGPREDVLRRWTLIEAVLKADGRGLQVDPAEVRLIAGRFGAHPSARVAGDRIRYRLAEIPAPEGWIASLAWK